MASASSDPHEYDEIINRMSSLLGDNTNLEYEDEESNDDTLPEWKICLVFKLVTGRGYAFFILKEILTKAWRTSSEFSISDLGNNLKSKI